MVCSKMCTFSFIFIASLICLSTIPFVASLNFNFTSFSPNDGIFNYERDAFAASEAIQLTKNLAGESLATSIGRATYKKPMHLWDKASRNLTDLRTHFTFVIDSQGSNFYGDGLAFFLAPNGSVVPEKAKEGRAFGLTNDDQPLNTTVNHFVAVEFDIFRNRGWDPENSNEHLGVDINSVRSVANVSWLNSSFSIRQGLKNEAWISYDSSVKNLSIVLHTSLNGTNRTTNQNLHYVVDLRDYLPDYVTFGFSAATGAAYAKHQIYSWEFNSTLETDEDVTLQTDPRVEGPSVNEIEENEGNKLSTAE